LKRILLVSDVKGWGGWVRAEYIKKYLSDEFYFDIVDGWEFNEWEKSGDQREDYDLYYFLFHTMLQKKTAQRLLVNGGANVITIVTGYPTLKPCFSKTSLDPRFMFNKLARGCRAIGSNNLKSLEDLEEVWNSETFYAPRGVDPEIFYPLV